MKSWHLEGNALTETNGTRTTPVLPEHNALEFYALAILRRANRQTRGNVLTLAAWMAAHMLNGKVTVSEGNLIALGIGRLAHTATREVCA
jgi:hypothetical protein